MKEMRMDEGRLREVLTLSKIDLPENEFNEVLRRVNDVFAMCDEMAELDLKSVEPFDWKVRTPQGRRCDCTESWNGRDKFLSQAPTADGDFFRVPRIIDQDNGSEEADE